MGWFGKRREESGFATKKYYFDVCGRTFSIYDDASDSLLATSLAQSRTWEPWQLDIYSRIIEPDFVCLDVGGNIGTSAIALATFADRGHVYSFEPVPYTYSLLQRNVLENGITNVTPIQSAISNRTGKALILVDRERLGDARQAAEHQVAALSLRPSQYVVPVELETLDRWMDRNQVSRADFIKVDVEGFEIEVLQGGVQAFGDNEKLVAIFEFAVQPQRNATGRSFPDSLKDYQLFQILKRSFRQIYLIGRNTRLFAVDSYAKLRCLMIGGYPVEDLLCCQELPSALAEIVAAASYRPTSQLSSALTSSAGTLLLFNRYNDGWSTGSHDIEGTRVGMCAMLERPVDLTIRFGPIYSKHSGRSTHPVIAAVGNELRRFDVTNDEHRESVSLAPGISWIFIESEHSVEAKSYLGNPSDPRSVGFRVQLEGWEQEP